MFLKRLEVFGFKSFADRLDVTFSNGITAIVGPNGSGKSNVSDAVRWVLGEQSAKQLRGAAMADVIFKGTDARKPLSYCEVSLVFDNTDKGLDIEYSEVVITRRLYRSGESEYYINKSGVRLKDIVTLFQDTGIGKEGYSIVGQGKIENILSGKQEERRAVFEEAAGIVKYKARKIESERNLQSTSENLARINDILDTLGERIEPLSAQADTAREYLSLRESLRTLEVNFFLAQNELAEQRRNSFNLQLEGIDTEREEKTLHIGNIAAENQRLNGLLDETEATLASLREQLLTLTADSENMQGQSKVLLERIGNLKEQISRIFRESEGNAQRRKSMEDALNGDDSAKEETQKKIDGKRAEVEGLEKDIAERDAALSAERDELEELKAGVLANMNRLSDVKANISRYEAMSASIKERRTKIAASIEIIRAQRVNIEDALKEQNGGAEEYNRATASLKEKANGLKEQSEKLIRERDNISAELQKKQNEVNAASSRLKVLEDLKRDFEGYNFSVKKLLTRAEKDGSISRHICGVLAQLISVPEKYEVAIEAALGSAMQNIVTPNEQDAKALIEYLRANDLGRATFLPVSAVRGRGADSREAAAVKTNGSYGFASDLIEFDSEYEGVIASLLGRTVITDNLDVAIAIANKTGHSLKIVTLKGDVMNAGGSMSGGSMRQKTSSILGREREIEALTELIKNASGDNALLRSRLEDVKTRLSACERERTETDTALHKQEVESARDLEKLNALNGDLQESIRQEEQLNGESEQLKDTLNEIESELKKIGEAEGDTESVNKEAQANINARQAEHNRRQLERDKAAEVLTNAKITLTGLEKELDAMVNNAERMGELIKGLDESDIRLNSQRTDFESKLKEAENALEDNGLQTAETLKKLEKVGNEVKDKEQARDGLQGKIKENDDTRRRFEQEVYDAGERRHKVELALAKVDNDLSYLENRIWEEYELTKATAEELRDGSFKMNGAQTEINRLKKAIAALGNVNVNAIEEYVETKERFDDLTKQSEDLQKAADDLNDIIAELTKKMDKQFKEQFALINANFTKIFSELFGGGRAELKLSEADSSLDADIEIVAQPPGKSLQLLSLLSGGERALTAIAILFSMMKLKPTPFCILDEIEAALDEANVGNVASYLRKFSNETQFIVITHRKPTMEEADSLYGVAMEEKGVSKIVSVKLT